MLRCRNGQTTQQTAITKGQVSGEQPEFGGEWIRVDDPGDHVLRVARGRGDGFRGETSGAVSHARG